MKAVTRFKRHSRSLSQQSLNKMMEDVRKQEEPEKTIDKKDDDDDVKHIQANAEALTISSSNEHL